MLLLAAACSSRLDKAKNPWKLSSGGSLFLGVLVLVFLEVNITQKHS